MSSDVSVFAQDLSKSYPIYKQPVDRLKQFILPKLRAILSLNKKNYFNDFQALDKISFEIRKGETVGIIGRNGSGKSTLLQLICGTLSPSTGNVEVYGRVAAILELGSGFNLEFTGRENVYMNGAVYGLNKEDINTRMHEIEAFADIGEFIDQPVKMYSSGMHVRLAFAVIANVDADILIIDEALAVGDAVFMQKCMRFLRKFKEKGTLVFVSHDISSVINLCERAIWLDHGKSKMIGASKEVAEAYLKYTLQEVYGHEAQLEELNIRSNTQRPSDDSLSSEIIESTALDYCSEAFFIKNISHSGGWKTGVAEIISVRIEKTEDNSSDIFLGGEKVILIINAKAYKDIYNPILGFLLKDRLGQDLFGENTLPFTDTNPHPVSAGEVFTGKFSFRLPMLPNGQYAVTATVSEGTLENHIHHHWLHEAILVNVLSSKIRWGLVGINFSNVEMIRK